MNTPLSLTGKLWQIQNPNLNPSNLTEFFLKLRQIKNPDSFLNPLSTKPTPPEKLKNLPETVSRLHKAIKSKERILLYGDYDVDGITSTTILFQALTALGANVSLRLPHRIKDGYGLSKNFYQECQELKVKLVISIDCGISNLEEITYGNSLKIQTIILDHHTCPPKLPPALHIINPRQPDCPYPFKDLTAAGLTYLLSFALLSNTPQAPLLEELVILSALGTLADCAPLLEENRFLVSKGLHNLRTSPPKHLHSLAETSGINLSEANIEDLSFRLIPRLNAAGRLDSPYLAFKFLQGNPAHSETLHRINTERQTLTHSAHLEAEDMLTHNSDPNLIFLHHPSWHPGIIGLIASRLNENHQIPSFICTTKPDGTIVGSARTPSSFHATQALRHSSDLLLHFGGHREAAGFSLTPENLTPLKEKLSTYAKKNFSSQTPTLTLDTTLPHSSLNLQTFESLTTLEPFGIGNPRPLFLLEKVRLTSLKTIGKNKNHLALSFSTNEQKTYRAISWANAPLANKLTPSQTYDLAAHLNKNVFNGSTTLEFEIIDLRTST